jgi:hypothetical protein
MASRKHDTAPARGQEPAQDGGAVTETSTPSAATAKTPAPSNPANDNLSLWQSVKDPNPKYTKPFRRAGGFEGTATNATHLAELATEKFGPCGIGWGFNVLDERLLQGAPILVNGAVVGHTQVHRVHLRLWYVLDGRRGEVEHFGQTEFVGRRRSGDWYTDEEAPKKSLTDAMSKCLSMLGFAASIHLGLWDDNKYVAAVKADYAGDHGAQGQQAQAPVQQPAVQQPAAPRARVEPRPQPRGPEGDGPQIRSRPEAREPVEPLATPELPEDDKALAETMSMAFRGTRNEAQLRKAMAVWQPHYLALKRRNADLAAEVSRAFKAHHAKLVDAAEATRDSDGDGTAAAE